MAIPAGTAPQPVFSAGDMTLRPDLGLLAAKHVDHMVLAASPQRSAASLLGPLTTLILRYLAAFRLNAAIVQIAESSHL